MNKSRLQHGLKKSKIETRMMLQTAKICSCATLLTFV
jgi:hypothetical protein